MKKSIDAIKVLVVDDDALIIKAVTCVMNQFNTQISTAVDSQSALNLVQSHHFDLIFVNLELNLQDNSGYELLAAIRIYEKAHPRGYTFVVGLTGYDVHEITQTQNLNQVYKVPFSVSNARTILNNSPFFMGHDNKVSVLLVEDDIGCMC